MPESDEVAEDIKKIKWRLESIDASQILMIKADRKKYLDVVEGVFGRARRRVTVYREIDGNRSQTELASDMGMDESNLSKVLRILRDGGLIEVKRIARDGSTVYMKTKWHRVLSIAKWLDETFGKEEE
ncbi:MAG: helix-turn-helix domain-containing protein [Candidatus Thorarchaeota archaeon]|nr:helix-turn-helix domain-containing protein [Candidatus Thorarchaeota archaeon]